MADSGGFTRFSALGAACRIDARQALPDGPRSRCSASRRSRWWRLARWRCFNPPAHRVASTTAFRPWKIASGATSSSGARNGTNRLSIRPTRRAPFGYQDQRQAPLNRPRPTPRRPEAAPTVNIMVFGDSLSDWLAYGLEEAFAETPRSASCASRAPTPD